MIDIEIKELLLWLLDRLFNFLQSEDPQTGYELPYKHQASQSWLLAISFQAQGCAFFSSFLPWKQTQSLPSTKEFNVSGGLGGRL